MEFTELFHEVKLNGNHLIVQNTSNQVGVFAHNNGDWIASNNFNLEPDGLWHQIAVVCNSNTSKFLPDGFYQGFSDRPTGDKIKTIGNTNLGGQRFAEYIDDFRVYGIALTDFEIEKFIVKLVVHCLLLAMATIQFLLG